MACSPHGITLQGTQNDMDGLEGLQTLSTGMRHRLEATHVEMARLHALSDRWLAEALLRLVRTARAAHPCLQNPHEANYATAFLWQAVPEAARRLGGKLVPNEVGASEFKTITNEDFRAILGNYLKNTDLRKYDADAHPERLRPNAVDLLSNGLVNGNPVAMAADRIHLAPPAGVDRHDWIARHMREVSAHRGHPATAEWSPHLSGKPQASVTYIHR